MDMKALLNERVSVKDEMTALNDSIGDDEDFDDDQQDKWSVAQKRLKVLDAKIIRGENLASIEANMRTVPDSAMELAEDAGVEIEGMARGGERVIDKDPNRGFGDNGFGDFAACIYRKATAGITDPRLSLMAAAGDPTQQMSIATDGGFLVPPSFSTEIWDKVTAGDSSGERIISSCDTFTIPFGTESMTFPAIVNESRANGSRNGGLQGFWKDELTQMTSTTAELREITLTPQELYVFSFISDKLLKNTSLMTQWLTRNAPKEIRFKMANAIISGTGGAQPKGLRGAAGTVDQAKTGGQPKDTITATNIRKMWSRVPDESRMSGFWLYDISCEEQIAGFTQAVGTGGVPLMTPDGGISVSPFVTLLGRPLVPSEFAYELGDSGDLMFVDLSAYGLAVRGNIQTDVSMHLKFDFNQTAFRFLFEVDGSPMLNSAITPFTPGGTTKTRTVSPFVTLAERA